jgi:hypothetical protein
MIMIILVIGISLGLLAFSFNGNDEPNISESTKNYVYIPSDMTKANPNFVMEYNESLWSATNIEDVKDEVVYTIQGKVLSIGDPIDWNRGNGVSLLTGSETIIGYIPITISVDNVYKGKLGDDEFTFYVGSQKDSNLYRISNESAHFEIGENVLVNLSLYKLGEGSLTHLEPDENSPFPDGHYYPKLAHFGKYQLQPVVNALGANLNSADIEYVAFNIRHPNGIPLDQVARLALP